MSTPTATILPAVCGWTSVCTSAARLPVASKNRGSCREIAGVVLTSIVDGVGLPLAPLLLGAPFERLQAARPTAAAAISKTKRMTLIDLAGVIYFDLFLSEFFVATVPVRPLRRLARVVGPSLRTTPCKRIF